MSTGSAGTTSGTTIVMPTLAARIRGFEKRNDNIVLSYLNSMIDLTKKRGNLLSNISNKDELKHEIAQRQTAIGHASQMVQYFKPGSDTELLRNEKFHDPLTGKITTTDANGRVKYVNKEYADVLSKIEDELEEKTDEIMKLCIKSNMLCGIVLQLSEASLMNALGKGKLFDHINGEYLDETFRDVDAMPNKIKTYVPESQTQLTACAKLRAFVQTRLEYVNMASFNNKESDRSDFVTNRKTVDETGNVKDVTFKPVIS